MESSIKMQITKGRKESASSNNNEKGYGNKAVSFFCGDDKQVK